MNERGDLMSLTPKCDMFLKSSCLLQPIQHIHPQSPPPSTTTPLEMVQNCQKSLKKIIQNQPKSIKIVQYGPYGPKWSKWIKIVQNGPSYMRYVSKKNCSVSQSLSQSVIIQKGGVMTMAFLLTKGHGKI